MCNVTCNVTLRRMLLQMKGAMPEEGTDQSVEMKK